MAPFGSFFVANTGDVEWQGNEFLTNYESSPGFVHAFCSRCGTAMTGANLAEPNDTFILAANALDGHVRSSVIAVEHLASKALSHDDAEKAPHYESIFPGWQTLKP